LSEFYYQNWLKWLFQIGTICEANWLAVSDWESGVDSGYQLLKMIIIIVEM
jgi:hypothetical protein